MSDDELFGMPVKIVKGRTSKIEAVFGDWSIYRRIDWVEKAAAAGVEGFMHHVELAHLVELATGKDVLEVGSYKGLSAWCTAHTAKSVMCVDTFKANDAGQTQMEGLTTYEAFKSAASQHENIDYIVCTSEEAHRQWAGPTNALFDLIFLDAMHDYESVKADIERWWPRLKTGGIMAFHDYGHDHFTGVQEAVDEAFGPVEGERGADGVPWVVTLRWVVK